MALYFCAGSAPSLHASTANIGIGCVWNPHATRRVWLVSLACYTDGNTSMTSPYRVYVTRATARGSGYLSFAFAIETDSEYGIAAPSGVVLDLGPYTSGSSPTAATPYLTSPMMFGARASAGQGFWMPFPLGLWIPPGTGVAIFQLNADTSGYWGMNAVVED